MQYLFVVRYFVIPVPWIDIARRLCRARCLTLYAGFFSYNGIEQTSFLTLNVQLRIKMHEACTFQSQLRIMTFTYSWDVSRGIRLVTQLNEFVKFLATILELQSNSHLTSLSHLIIKYYLELSRWTSDLTCQLANFMKFRRHIRLPTHATTFAKIRSWFNSSFRWLN